MTVCSHRQDDPGFFTSCALVCGGKCRCGEDAAASEASEEEGEA